MKHIILILSLFFFVKSYSQNLVYNGSFEQYPYCPNYITYVATGWINVIPDYDLLNSCDTSQINGDYYDVGVPCNWFGCQYPIDGDGYISISASSPIYSNRREWVKGNLITPLIKDSVYKVSFWFSKSDNFSFSSSKFGVYFGDISVNNINNPNFGDIDYDKVIYLDPINCDTINWTLFELYYFSKGNENSIMIGTFFPDSLIKIERCFESTYNDYCYYYIDDVKVERVLFNNINENIIPNNVKIINIYNEIGQVIPKLQGGMNIVQYSDLTFKKIFIF